MNIPTCERLYVLRAPEQKENCIRYISTLVPNNDRPLQITIKPYKKRRSVQANARYWSILTTVAQEAFRLGLCESYYSPEHFHEYFKRLFLGKKVVINGDVLLLPESSANKSTMEFQDFVLQVEVWAAENGIVIPEYGE